MIRVLQVVGAFAWAAVVFAGTLWATFPSEAIVNRLRYEVPRVMGSEYSADIGRISPWWIGLSADDVKLYKGAPGAVSTPVPPSGEGEDAEAAPEQAGP